MKARLNLTVDEQLLAAIKKYAQKNNTNVSELVEHFFKKILKPAPARQKTIIDLIEKLDKPELSPDTDLISSYYKDQAKKYGI